MSQTTNHFKLIVMGVSYGGMNALQTILPVLPENFPVPVVIVQHMSPNPDSYLVSHLDSTCSISVKEAEDKEELKAGRVYLAPADYHILIEDDMTLSLTVEEKVNYSRPSIDVLFDSAAYAFGRKVIGVVLTGANTDGSLGLAEIKKNGGIAIVQSPETAVASVMPQGAIDAVMVDHILPLHEIAPFLVRFIVTPRSDK